METDKYLRSIAYYYAMGRLDQIDPYAVGAWNVGHDFSNKYVDQVYGAKSVFTAWELYVNDLRHFVVVDLGVGSEDDGFYGREELRDAYYRAAAGGKGRSAQDDLEH